jgi:hypothetical protein
MVEVTENVTVSGLRSHLLEMLKPGNMFAECLYTGNVGAKEARDWFTECKSIVRHGEHPETCKPARPFFAPGTSVRSLASGENYEIHMQSKNEEEEVRRQREAPSSRS